MGANCFKIPSSRILIVLAIQLAIFSPAAIQAQSNPFITTWKTDNSGTSASTQITIPTNGSGYNYSVSWEEVGNSSNSGSLASQTGDLTIDFPSAGTYKVSISGDFPTIYFFEQKDQNKILTIEQWGDIQWTSMAGAFYYCSNLTYNATDKPSLSGVTSMNNMFEGATSFNGNIGSWDVSTVTSMKNLFYKASKFNRDISTWDVSNVTTMSGMFANTDSFNIDISSWNVAKVTDFSSMFSASKSFNQNIGLWNLSSATNVGFMFSYSKLSSKVYDLILKGWAASSNTPTGMDFGAHSLNYCVGTPDRQKLIDDKSWVFRGDSYYCTVQNIPGRAGAVSFTVTKGTFIGLGKDASGPLKDLYKANFTNSQLNVLNGFPGAARTEAVSFVLRDTAYVGLGKDGSGTALKDFYKYDATNDTWTQVADFGGGVRSNAVAFAIDDAGYVGTGSDGTTEYADLWKYDPAKNTWEKLGNLGSNVRQGASAFVIGGGAYVAGGYYTDGTAKVFPKDLYQYAPASDTWTIKLVNDANLSLTDAAGFTLYDAGFIAYGNQTKVLLYNPKKGTLTSLGDALSLGTAREDPTICPGKDLAYLGLGAFGSTAYDDEFRTFQTANQQPTDVQLSQDTVAENLALSSFVASLTSTDPDEYGTPKYTIDYTVSSAHFKIVDDSLRTNRSINYETDRSFPLRIKVTDSRGGTFTKDFTIYSKDQNDPITKLELKTSEVAEARDSTVLVGDLHITDEDSIDTYMASVVPDLYEGNHFTTVGTKLYIINPNYEFKSTYNVRVTVTDAGGALFAAVLSVKVTDADDPYEGIRFSSRSVNEGESNQLVGNLSVKDDDPGDTYSFALAAADGILDADNDRFSIDDFDRLYVTDPDFEEQDTLYVHIEVTNEVTKAVFKEPAEIYVVDQNDRPTDILFTPDTLIDESLAIGTYCGWFTAVDEDAGDTHTYSGTSLYFDVSGDSLLVTREFHLIQDFVVSVNVEAVDAGGLAFSKTFDITVLNALGADLPRNNVLIYPNPFRERVVVDGVGIDRLEVYDLSGVCVFMSTDLTKVNRFDLSYLRPGVYILRVHSGNATRDMKVVKE